eukprot:XP_001710283.1 Hypothetical protein GL50803_10160 [Giardia lamblia ATCC 50803]
MALPSVTCKQQTPMDPSLAPNTKCVPWDAIAVSFDGNATTRVCDAIKGGTIDLTTTDPPSTNTSQSPIS